MILIIQLSRDPSLWLRMTNSTMTLPKKNRGCVGRGASPNRLGQLIYEDGNRGD